jgi:hypothetical protein
LRYDTWSRRSGLEKLTIFPRRFAEWYADFRRHPKPTDEQSKSVGPVAESLPEQDIVAAYLWELAGYSARPYSGRVALFTSEDAPVRKNRTACGWEEFVAKLEVHAIPGSHGGCVTAERHALFEKIKGCLEEPSVSGERTNGAWETAQNIPDRAELLPVEALGTPLGTPADPF